MNLGELIVRNARRTPDKVVLAKVLGEELTARELDERSNRLANALASLGIAKGDRVAILAENCLEYIELNAAAAKSGIVIAPMNIRYTPAELTALLEQIEPEALIFTPRYAGQIAGLHQYAGKRIVIGEPREGWIGYEEIVSAASPEAPQVEIAEDDLFSILFTSGTTGQPKGIMLSHRNLLANCINICDAYEVRSDEINLCFLPLFFSAAINCTIWPIIYKGGTNILMDKFDAADVLRYIEQYRATYIEVVPTIVLQLMDCPAIGAHDLSTLRAIVYGSAAMPRSRLAEARKTFGNIFAQIWGVTEASGVSTYLTPAEHIIGEGEDGSRLASCGREALNVQVEVVDEDGMPVAPGTIGELAVRGDHVMSGYWRSPEATERVFKNGWLLTGDLGRKDAAGYFFIEDRKKDIIISGGINISSKEIEDAIFEHPGVAEVAAIAIPDEKWGESVGIVVVGRDPSGLSSEDIVEHCKSRLASYKIPRHIFFADTLPRNPNGKIQKFVLRSQFAGVKRQKTKEPGE